MKEIKRYIQFAIDNGYQLFPYSSVIDIEYKHKVILWKEFPQYWTVKVHCLDDCDMPKEIKITNEDYCNTITSKPFIEAVARGKIKEADEFWCIVIDWGDVMEYYFFDEWTETKHWNKKDNIKALEDDITRALIFAIRDNKLPEFINNLI